MKRVLINSLKVISQREEYPSNCNSPTLIKHYQCLCGEGIIEENNTVGFNDRFFTLKCNNCLKKYKSYVEISGSYFELYKKNN